MALHRVVIKLVARQAPEVTEAFGCFSLRRQSETLVKLPAKGNTVNIAIATHGHSGHAFSAPSHHAVAKSRSDIGERHVNRRLCGAALAIYRHARNRLRPARRQQGGTGDVAALLADLGDTPKNHIIDVAWHDARPGNQLP